MTGVIVLTSSVFVFVCVSVCVLPLYRPNRQTYGPEFGHVGQVNKYLGQVHRSRSKFKVTWSKNVSDVYMCTMLKTLAVILVELQSDEDTGSRHCNTFPFWLLGIIICEHSTQYINGRATTRGVFKAYAFFVTRKSYSTSASHLREGA